jgi:hypothetical protein
MKFIPILILSIFLTGCALFKKEEPTVILPTTQVVHINPEVLTECSLLDTEILVPTFESAVAAYSNVTALYAVCANKQTISIKLLKQFGNIK